MNLKLKIILIYYFLTDAKNYRASLGVPAIVTLIETMGSVVFTREPFEVALLPRDRLYNTFPTCFALDKVKKKKKKWCKFNLTFNNKELKQYWLKILNNKGERGTGKRRLFSQGWRVVASYEICVNDSRSFS